MRVFKTHPCNSGMVNMVIFKNRANQLKSNSSKPLLVTAVGPVSICNAVKLLAQMRNNILTRTVGGERVPEFAVYPVQFARNEKEHFRDQNRGERIFHGVDFHILRM